MENYKKIDKEFLYTDNSINCYGFRLLTEGYLLEEFKKNPIGYFMHEDREDGVLVRWEDFRIDGDKVYAKPVVNLTHPRGERTVQEIENGFLNGASVGHYVLLEVSDDDALKLPGQTGVTVTKWYHRELSLVDVPGNFNALALYDSNDNILDLSNLSAINLKSKSNIKMSKVVLSATALGILALKAEQEGVDAALVDVKLQELKAKADAHDTVVNQFEQYKKDQSVKEVKNLIADAVKTGKVTQETADKLSVSFELNPTGLADLLATMSPYQSVKDKMKGVETADKYEGKTWDDLHKSNQLKDLKAENFDLFKVKYKEKFNKDFK